MHKSILLDKSYTFSLNIISLYFEMIHNNEYTISKQILRCGTSIGANAREASFAESRSDFTHKLKIAQKECNETIYWLDLIKDSPNLNYNVKSLYDESLIIMKIICNSIRSLKSNEKKLSQN